MPLIKAVDDTTVNIKAKIPKSLNTEIEQYMKWVGLANVNHFIEQAVEYVLKNNKDWKKEKERVATNTV